MPQSDVLFYQESPGEAPVLAWLKTLRGKDPKAYANCVAAIERLAMFGHELRRPIADYLRDGIYELRIRRGRVNYRILYFFHGRNAAILAHALTKEDRVPDTDIDRAIQRKALFVQAPDGHSFQGDFEHG